MIAAHFTATRLNSLIKMFLKAPFQRPAIESGRARHFIDKYLAIVILLDKADYLGDRSNKK